MFYPTVVGITIAKNVW